MKANERQVGGSHYKGTEVEHWDIAWMFSFDYYQGQITKYVMRWRDKNGLEDLEKARHFLEKYIELVKANSQEADVDAETSGIITKEPIPHPGVKPSGYVGFVFEGTDADGSLFTCSLCRTAVRIKPDYDPSDFHRCGADVTRRYIDQG